IDREVKGVIHDVVTVARELLSGGCGCRDNERLSWKLFMQAFEQLLDGFDFADRDRMNPDTPPKLRQFHKAQAVRKRRKILAKPNEIIRTAENQCYQKQHCVYEIHAWGRVYLFI